MTFIPSRHAGALLSLFPSASSSRRGGPLLIDWRESDGAAVLGIDPGTTGGVTAVDLRGRRILFSAPMPTVELERRGRAKRRVDGRGLARILAGRDIVHAYVEDPGVVTGGRPVIDPETGEAKPNRAAGSIATLHAAVGAIEATLDAIGITQSRVLPVHWKKPFGLLRVRGDKKRASNVVGAQMWPADFAGVRVRDNGQVEAALLALYGARYVRAHITR